MKVSNNRLILIILSILCFVMIGVTTLRDEWLSPLRTAVGYLLMPVQSGVNRVGRSLYNSIRDHEELKSALQDKRELQEQVDQLIMENTRLQADRFELDRLRRLYELNREYGQYRMTGARVIAKDTGGWFHIFRIDKGAADGIRVDMNVLAGGGLVGIVTDVGANYATIRSIIDDVSRVSAMEIKSRGRQDRDQYGQFKISARDPDRICERAEDRPRETHQKRDSDPRGGFRYTPGGPGGDGAEI